MVSGKDEKCKVLRDSSTPRGPGNYGVGSRVIVGTDHSRKDVCVGVREDGSSQVEKDGEFQAERSFGKQLRKEGKRSGKRPCDGSQEAKGSECLGMRSMRKPGAKFTRPV